MKIIRYEMLCKTAVYNAATDAVEQQDAVCTMEIPWSEENEERAKREAMNGEYIIEDDGSEEEATPTQLDIIEAQVTYTAMMTDTLLEV